MKSFKDFKKKLKSDKAMKDDGWETETIEISCNCGHSHESDFDLENIDEMAMPSHDLNGMFNRFNKAHFFGAVPKVPVKYASLKGKTGLASATWWVRRVGRTKQYELKELNWIKINKNVVMPEDYTGDILMHEMIHIYLFTQNIARTTGDPSHGKEFVEDKKNREKTYGRTIPLRDDVDHELSDVAKKGKETGIFTYEKPDGQLVYHLYTLKNWRPDAIGHRMERIIKMLKDKGSTNAVLGFKVRFGTISSTLHLSTKVGREINYDNPYKGYSASSEEKREILKNMKNMKEY